MIEKLPQIIISLIFIAAITLVAFFVDFSGKGKAKTQEEVAEKQKSWMSKTGSIIFYCVMGFLLLFFLVMYIRWRMIYG